MRSGLQVCVNFVVLRLFLLYFAPFATEPMYHCVENDASFTMLNTIVTRKGCSPFAFFLKWGFSGQFGQIGGETPIFIIAFVSFAKIKKKGKRQKKQTDNSTDTFILTLKH